eukprot:scaffold5504_cov102-Cylindrotheca_fusiformis.AAC.1
MALINNHPLSIQGITRHKRWLCNDHPLRLQRKSRGFDLSRDGCREYSDVIICDRSDFQGSNDGSATIIR